MNIIKNSLVTLCVLTASSGLLASESTVARAAFASGITDREPVNTFEVATTDISPVYFFTELSQFQDQQVTHRWIYNDEQQAEVVFNVGGPRWRVYSSKTMLPEWTGEWTVQILHEDQVVDQYQFTYIEAAEKTDNSVETTEESVSSNTAVESE